MDVGLAGELGVLPTFKFYTRDAGGRVKKRKAVGQWMQSVVLVGQQEECHERGEEQLGRGGVRRSLLASWRSPRSLLQSRMIHRHSPCN